MRKALVLFLSALTFNQLALAQETETIEGNGKLITRDVVVSSFTALKASGVYELKLLQGDKESVKIEADENLQILFQVHNEGSRLVIEMEKLKNINLKAKNKMKVYVTFKKLKELELSTVGKVGSEKQLTFDDLSLKNAGVGDIDLSLITTSITMENKGVGKVTLSGSAQNAIVKNLGVGSLDAGNFVVQTMNIENTGVGSAEVNAEKDLKIKDSFLGKVKNKGAAQIRKMNRVKV